MFDVLCGTVVRAAVVKSDFGLLGADWGTQPGEIRAEVGVSVCQGKRWLGWFVGSYNKIELWKDRFTNWKGRKRVASMKQALTTHSAS